MSKDWEEFVGTAFIAALALFVALFYMAFADLSSPTATIESLEHLILAITLSFKPSGLSIAIDLVAAALTGVVSLQAVKQNVLAGIFIALFLYFFLAILGNYIFVIS